MVHVKTFAQVFKGQIAFVEWIKK